jgi:hypothetical protein
MSAMNLLKATCMKITKKKKAITLKAIQKIREEHCCVSTKTGSYAGLPDR